MANIRALRATDAWDQDNRLRYGSKGRLTSTAVFGGQCGTRPLFVPVTLSAPRRKRAENPEALKPRVVGGAEVGTLHRSASAPSTPASSVGPQHVSLGHTVRSCGAYCGEDNPHFPKGLEWYAEPGTTAVPPMSVSRSTFVDKSPQFDMSKPPTTHNDINQKLHRQQVSSGGQRFKANSLSRASFVSHKGHKDEVWQQGYERAYRRPKKRSYPVKDRSELTSSGGFQGWSADEMAQARGVATFTPAHTHSESFNKDERSPNMGRSLDYFRE